jgi:hypothetical protein
MVNKEPTHCAKYSTHFLFHNWVFDDIISEILDFSPNIFIASFLTNSFLHSFSLLLPEVLIRC